MSDDRELVEVIQADHDAASDLMRDHNGGVFPTLRSLGAIRAGLNDQHPLVQAFAYHRLQSLVAPVMVEARESELADRLIPLSHAKRDFQNEIGREITAGVEVGAKRESYCRLYLYGPDTGIDSYTTWTELAMLYAVLGEVFGALQGSTGAGEAFQARVQPWMMECFGPEISADRVERCDRFIEEALELVQASGYEKEHAHALVEYVYGRDQGEINQEVGGVMVTLAAYCLAFGADMHAAGETELARISHPDTIAKIRAKQATKPQHPPLPIVEKADRLDQGEEG